MSLKRLQREDRRLLILNALNASPDYALTGQVMQSLLAEYGHRLSHAALAGELAWLQDLGLIRLSHVTGEAAIDVINITVDGADVAQGRVILPGIRRPAPEE